MAVEVKLQTASARDDTSDDASSVTAVSYEDHTPAVKGHPGALTAVPASPSTSYRTPDDILRLTTEDNFFQPCPSCSLYRSGREVQLTFYNLDSHRPCCSVCKHLQGTKAVVQVRRSSYHDVVRVSEIVHMFDISSIQPYWINNDRVVFLRPRPQPRPPRGCSFPAVCRMCNRQLMDSHSCYCSLQCKLQGAYGLDSAHGRTPMAMLPHWGNARKRSAPAAESSHMDDKDFHHLQSPRSCSEDEDGLSSAKWMASRFAFNTLPLAAGSKKRKLTPIRSPLQ